MQASELFVKLEELEAPMEKLLHDMDRHQTKDHRSWLSGTRHRECECEAETWKLLYKVSRNQMVLIRLLKETTRQ